MNLYNVLAKLIDYPSAELMEHLNEVLTVVDTLADINESEKKDIREFISWLTTHKPIRLQQIYVQTFDMVPEHDLHLTHHLFGDDNNRGPALIDLAEYYKEAGLEVKSKEIPDYLPLMLEYASTLDTLQVQVFFGDVVKVLQIIADNLDKVESPYAKLIRLIENRGSLAKAA